MSSNTALKKTSRKDRILYLAVGSVDGPHSSIWRVWWSSEGDVYIAARSIAGILKVSLHHTSDVRHSAFQDKYFEKNKSKIKERTLDRWKRKYFKETNTSYECALYIPTQDLRDFVIEEKIKDKIFWIGPPSEGKEVDISFFIQDKGEESNDWPGKEESFRTQLIKKTVLGDGTVLFIVFHYSDEKWPSNKEDLQKIKAEVPREVLEKSENRLLLFGQHHQGLRYMFDYAADRLITE